MPRPQRTLPTLAILAGAAAVAALAVVALRPSARTAAHDAASHRVAAPAASRIATAWGELPDGATPLVPERQTWVVARPNAQRSGPHTLVRSQAELERLWSDVAPGKTPPAIDFRRHALLSVRTADQAPSTTEPWAYRHQGRTHVVLPYAARSMRYGTPATALHFYLIPTAGAPVATVRTAATAYARD